jgi:hypothetical protein
MIRPFIVSSWPGLSQASTSLLSLSEEDVDGRDKPGHDAERVGDYAAASFFGGNRP